MKIKIEGDCEVLRKVVKSFGTTAHVIVGKKYEGQEVVILICGPDTTISEGSP